MLKLILDKIRPALLLLIVLSLLLGIAYPLIVTAIGQVLFPWQANGSFVSVQGKVVGSVLIGQYFSDPKYFWGRVSATTPYPYNAENSSASNLAPSNPQLIRNIEDQIKRLQNNTMLVNTMLIKQIPIDLVTSSASGLDPEISPLAAYYQVARIAKARKISEQVVLGLIEKQIQKPFLNIWGEPRLKVLELNLILDQHAMDKVEK